jgi:hypothetical protein
MNDIELEKQATLNCETANNAAERQIKQANTQIKHGIRGW